MTFYLFILKGGFDKSSPYIKRKTTQKKLPVPFFIWGALSEF